MAQVEEDIGHHVTLVRAPAIAAFDPGAHRAGRRRSRRGAQIKTVIAHIAQPQREFLAGIELTALVEDELRRPAWQGTTRPRGQGRSDERRWSTSCAALSRAPANR